MPGSDPASAAQIPGFCLPGLHTGSVSYRMHPDRDALARAGPGLRARLELRRSPARSDGIIAEAAGVHHSTVARQRAALEARGEIPATPKRRERPRPQPSPARDAIAALGLDAATSRAVADAAGISMACAWRMLRKMRAQAVPCAHCGKLFAPPPMSQRIYCSDSCKQARARAARRSRHHPARDGQAAEAELHATYRNQVPVPDLRKGYCATCGPDKRDLWTSGHPADLKAARSMCLAACPVLDACRAWSLTLPDTDGAIYGGLSHAGRIELKYVDPQVWDRRARELGI